MNLQEGIDKIKTLIDKFSAEKVENVEVKFLDAKLNTGEILRTPTEFKQGEIVTIVTDQGELPCPDGEYTFEDGSKLVVMGGLVAEFEPAADVAAEESSPVDPVAPAPTTPQTGAMETKVPKRVIKSQVEEHVFSIELEDYEVIKVDLSSMFKEIEDLKQVNKELFAVVQELSAQPSTKPTEKVKDKFNVSEWRKSFKQDLSNHK